SIYLAKTFRCRATGITITDNQVDQAYKKAEKAGVSHLTDFYRMDFENTSFQDNTFSVVWGLESICYAQSKEDFLKEAFRVLKDRGRVIVADGFASRREYQGKDAKLMQRWLDGWIVNHLNTGEEFREFTERIGYTKSEYTDVTDYVKKTSWIMFLVSLPFLPLHIIDQFIRIKQYPTDALFHQYFAMRKKLWEYGIFYAEK
ncbi:MAG: SAM-dependent methyltransferase, partial [Chitinivibrionales bacterium]